GLTLSTRQASRHVADWWVAHPPNGGLCHGATPVGSRLAAAVSYRAAWSLPEPVSHRLVDVDLCE
ncbi:MAG TPA: hypothetical protein VEP50_19660, partial [bacterium]|nr:hypothetical protein [bacterium]